MYSSLVDAVVQRRPGAQANPTRDAKPVRIEANGFGMLFMM